MYALLLDIFNTGIVYIVVITIIPSKSCLYHFVSDLTRSFVWTASFSLEFENEHF
jgi:hypothetical protein